MKRILIEVLKFAWYVLWRFCTVTTIGVFGLLLYRDFLITTAENSPEKIGTVEYNILSAVIILTIVGGQLYIITGDVIKKFFSKKIKKIKER